MGQIDYSLELDYGEDGPGEDAMTPGEDEIATYVLDGMRAAGLPLPNIVVSRQ